MLIVVKRRSFQTECKAGALTPLAPRVNRSEVIAIKFSRVCLSLAALVYDRPYMAAWILPASNSTQADANRNLINVEKCAWRNRQSDLWKLVRENSSVKAFFERRTRDHYHSCFRVNTVVSLFIHHNQSLEHSDVRGKHETLARRRGETSCVHLNV